MNLKQIRVFGVILSFFKMTYYGGQAVMNGVMMKGEKNYSISLYNQNQIHTKNWEYISLTKKYKFLNIPFLRGIINLIEMLILGYKSLTYSSEFSYEKETEETSSTFFHYY